MKKDHVEGIDSAKWEIVPSAIFAEEFQRIQSALAGGSEEFLAYFPGKVFLKLATDVLGMDSETYVDLICKSLQANSTDPAHALGGKIEQALVTHLPQRQINA